MTSTQVQTKVQLHRDAYSAAAQSARSQAQSHANLARAWAQKRDNEKVAA